MRAAGPLLPVVVRGTTPAAAPADAAVEEDAARVLAPRSGSVCPLPQQPHHQGSLHLLPNFFLLHLSLTHLFCTFPPLFVSKCLLLFHLSFP